MAMPSLAATCRKWSSLYSSTHSYKWDQHSELYNLHTQNAREVDKPIAGLLKDLKSRELLKDTLVIWAGEWSYSVSVRRWPRSNPYGYSIWMAGGGSRADLLRAPMRSVPRCRGPHAHSRFSCHSPSSAWFESRASDLPLQRQGFSTN